MKGGRDGKIQLPTHTSSHPTTDRDHDAEAELCRHRHDMRYVIITALLGMARHLPTTERLPSAALRRA